MGRLLSAAGFTNRSFRSQCRVEEPHGCDGGAFLWETNPFQHPHSAFQHFHIFTEQTAAEAGSGSVFPVHIQTETNHGKQSGSAATLPTLRA